MFLDPYRPIRFYCHLPGCRAIAIRQTEYGPTVLRISRNHRSKPKVMDKMQQAERVFMEATGLMAWHLDARRRGGGTFVRYR